MTYQTAWAIVQQYETLVAGSGQEYTDKHYLAVGTPREAANRAVLEKARRIVTTEKEEV